MDAYDPNFICNHSDHQGRYAFNQQPNIGLFNLSCFAQAILPLLAKDESEQAIAAAVDIAKGVLANYQYYYLEHYTAGMRAKLGLHESYTEDEALVKDLLDLMAQDRVDFTILFRTLCTFSGADIAPNDTLRDMFLQREAFDAWAGRYKLRLQQEIVDEATRQSQMRRVNPKYILRNYMAEAAIRKAQYEMDYSEIDRLFTLLQSPFDEQPEHERYAGYPPDWAKHISVSCSS